MRHFYGVYLESTAVSTILDLIRFLGEPDSIRFSHITLRGPYASRLSKLQLHRFNASHKDRVVELLRPANFFSEEQCTVVVEVDLRLLNDLFYKPDFPNGVPHLTIYDGKDPHFATEIFNLISRYEWRSYMPVGQLQEITPKKRLDQEFVSFFINFYNYFHALIGDPRDINVIHSLSTRQRSEIMESILERCVTNTPHLMNFSPSESVRKLTSLLDFATA